MSRLEAIREMMREEPNDPFLRYALALEFEKVKAVDDAVFHLQQLKLNHPDYLPTYYMLGKLCAAQGDTQQSIEVYRQGIDLARLQSNVKTLSELKEALFLLQDEE